MATVYVSMGLAGARGQSDEVAAFIGSSLRSESITSSGTSARGNLVAVQNNFAVINCATAVWATTQATATATNGIYVPAGVSQVIALAAGDRIAVLDV
jgi:hypothetical protein